MDDFLDMPFLNEDHVGRHLTLGLLARCMSFLEPYDTRVMFGRISTLDRFRQGFKEWLFALLGLGRFSQSQFDDTGGHDANQRSNSFQPESEPAEGDA